jgi:hypothetical protein
MHQPKPIDTSRIKLPPDQVPYVNLAEAEKQYDKNAARETLKANIARGDRIIRWPNAKKGP